MAGLENPSLELRPIPGLIEDIGSPPDKRPKFIRSYNGPEFVAMEIGLWLKDQGIGTHLIDPGKPWQNSFAGTFDARFRDECPNGELFRGVPEARVITRAFRQQFNEQHPHSSLGFHTPNEFADLCP